MIGFGKRKKILIDRLQYRLLGINLFHLTCIIFLFLIAIFSPVIIALYGSPSPEQAEQASAEFLGLHKRIWPAVPLALLLISLHSIVISHRIAGPLYRFRKVFEAVEQGDMTIRAVIRKKDYLGREADSLNQMIDGLQGRLRSIDDSIGEVRSACSRLEAVLGPEHRTELASLGGRLGMLRDRMDRFRLSESETRTEEPRKSLGHDLPSVRGLAELGDGYRFRESGTGSHDFE